MHEAGLSLRFWPEDLIEFFYQGSEAISISTDLGTSLAYLIAKCPQ